MLPLQHAMHQSTLDVLQSQNCKTFALIFLGTRLKLEVQMHDELFRKLMQCHSNFSCLAFVRQIARHSQINAYHHLNIP